jgi:hypothetical protein
MTVWYSQRAKIHTAHLLCDTVQRVIALAMVTNSTRDRNVGGRARDHLAVFVHVAHGDLNRRVVLSFDQTAGGSALPRHVKINKLTLHCVSIHCPGFSRMYWHTYVVVLHIGLGIGRASPNDTRN